jgi:hypothetical protein
MKQSADWLYRADANHNAKETEYSVPGYSMSHEIQIAYWQRT